MTGSRHPPLPEVLKEHPRFHRPSGCDPSYTLGERFKHTQAWGNSKPNTTFPPLIRDREANQIKRAERFGERGWTSIPNSPKKFLNFIIR